jgi:hypothetical protein
VFVFFVSVANVSLGGVGRSLFSHQERSIHSFYGSRRGVYVCWIYLIK